MVQRRSVVVFVLCTAFVLAFYAVLSYEAGGVELASLQSPGPAQPCTAGAACGSFSLASATLTTANFTDELGPAGYSNLTLTLTVAANGSIQSFDVYIGGTKLGTLTGPYGPGTDRAFTFTLPSTDPISRGSAYVVSVKGLVGTSAATTVVWKTETVTAR